MVYIKLQKPTTIDKLFTIQLLMTNFKFVVQPFKYGAQTALFKDPVRTAQ